MTAPSRQLIGSSSAIAAVRNAVEQVADTEATVLLLGETGTGKEIVARLIHSQSRRAKGPFIAANCGGVSPGLAASDLFGHEAGAFTNAIRRRTGRFEAAHHGTLFLDEIGELPLEIQPLLLHAYLRKRQSNELAAIRSPWMCGSSPQRTELFRLMCKQASSAPTCSTDSMSFRSPSHRFAIAAMISPSWRTTSSDTSRRSIAAMSSASRAAFCNFSPAMTGRGISANSAT